MTKPGLCPEFAANEDAAEFNEAHAQQCGHHEEHLLTLRLRLEDDGR